MHDLEPGEMVSYLQWRVDVVMVFVTLLAGVAIVEAILDVVAILLGDKNSWIFFNGSKMSCKCALGVFVYTQVANVADMYFKSVDSVPIAVTIPGIQKYHPIMINERKTIYALKWIQTWFARSDNNSALMNITSRVHELVMSYERDRRTNFFANVLRFPGAIDILHWEFFIAKCVG